MIDEITLLRDADELDPLGAARLAAMRAPLEAAIAEERATPRVGNRHGRRPWLVAAAAATAVAIALPVALTGGSATQRRVEHPSATGNTILARLADVAIAQPATVPPGPGQYEYTASTEVSQSCGNDANGATYCALVPESRQIWIGADGSGRIRESFGTPEFLTPADQAAWTAAGSPSLGEGTSDTSFGAGTLDDGPANLANVPTDPALLKIAIDDRSIEGGPPGAAEDFTQIGDLLRETDASPALRSALFQVASELPGIVMLGSVSNHDGRPGVGVAMDESGIRNELIFDAATSALTGEASVALIDSPDGYAGVAAGTLLGWTVYDASGIVDSTGATPTGTVPPAPPVTCTAVPAAGNIVPAPTTADGSAVPAMHCVGAP